jgi:hypothetical protein
LDQRMDVQERAPQDVGADKGYHNAEWVKLLPRAGHRAGSRCREAIGKQRAWTGASRARRAIRAATRVASGSKSASVGMKEIGGSRGANYEGHSALGCTAVRMGRLAQFFKNLLEKAADCLDQRVRFRVCSDGNTQAIANF